MANEPLVTGEIHFPPGTSPFSDATVVVRLEDVSLPDGPAPIVAQQVLRGVAYKGEPIPFTLTGTLPDDKRARYSVRAHVRFHGSDEIQTGDYITTQSFPVLSAGDHVHVRVQRVGR